jgi:hypothetical protein
MSLTWRIAPEQVGIGFDHLGEFSETIDAVVHEGRCRPFTGTEHGEAAVFRIHIDTDFLRQVLVLAEHFGDTADCEDVALMVKPPDGPAR